MTDLSLVTTDELVEEFKKRFDTFVVAGIACKTKDSGRFLVTWDGDAGQAIYLCELTKRDVLDYFHESKEELEE